MAINTCLPLLASYLEAVATRYTIRGEDHAGCWLETPFYLPDNTRLGVYLKPLPGGRVEISDYGETMGNLYLSGVTLESEDRRLVTIGQRFGVTTTGGEISLVTDENRLADAVNAVIHAMLDLSYLVYTRQIRAAPSFISEIDTWLTLAHRSYRHHYEVVGRSTTNTFDYYLPRQGRPVLMETISAIDVGRSLRRAKLTSFKVFDSLGAPDGGSFAYVCLLDDRTEQHREALTESVIQTVHTYFPTVLYWSDRAAREATLAA